MVQLRKIKIAHGFMSFILSDCPRDLIDEILLQRQKQQDQPEAKSREGETSQALSESSDEKQQSELTSAHLNQMLLDVFFGKNDVTSPLNQMLYNFVSRKRN